jgi:hypothetical protein
MKKKYSIYATIEHHTCWEVEASSIKKTQMKSVLTS